MRWMLCARHFGIGMLAVRRTTGGRWGRSALSPQPATAADAVARLWRRPQPVCADAISGLSCQIRCSAGRLGWSASRRPLGSRLPLPARFAASQHRAASHSLATGCTQETQGFGRLQTNPVPGHLCTRMLQTSCLTPADRRASEAGAMEHFRLWKRLDAAQPALLSFQESMSTR